MISISNIHLTLGSQYILKGVDLNAQDGECAAVVGPNGCGKSSLLKVIFGIEKPDQGQISIPNKSTMGYLPQEADLAVDHTLETELKSAFIEVKSALNEMQELEHKMTEMNPDSDQYQSILNKYADLTHFIDLHDGYNMDHQINRVASGLGFKVQDMPRSCREFSGGWQMRILLAKLLLRKPDIILLDEPTNHLDLETILWLEKWIKGFFGTILMVSHERAFMDRVVSKIYCLENGTGDMYKGSYSDYLVQSKLKREQHEKSYEAQLEEIARIEAFINRFRYNASKAALVQSRVKQLERIVRIPKPFHPTAIHFSFPSAPKSYNEVYVLKNLGHSYGAKKVFSDVHVTIRRGDKIGLVGVNGAGKSTLMRILAGKENSTKGNCIVGQNVNMQYFAQYDIDTLQSEQTLLQAMESTAPMGEQQKARDVLGAFLFSGAAVDKPLRALSGGERTRFRLARILFSPANVMLLDEPTNHLDITSRATVEKALQDYKGTVIVVSHDQVFMQRVTNRIFEIENGQLRVFPGNYEDYIRIKERMIDEENKEEQNNNISKETIADNALTSKEQRMKEHEDRKARDRQKRSIEKKITQTENEIEQAEKRISELDTEMSDPKIATDYSKLSQLNSEKSKFAETYTKLLEQWEQLQEELMMLEE